MRDGAMADQSVAGKGELAAMAKPRIIAWWRTFRLGITPAHDFRGFPESVIVTRLTDGVIVDTNDVFLNKIGRSRAE